MRYLIGALLVLNLLAFLYDHFGHSKSNATPQVQVRRQPDTGGVQLLAAGTGEDAKALESGDADIEDDSFQESNCDDESPQTVAGNGEQAATEETAAAGSYQGAGEQSSEVAMADNPQGDNMAETAADTANGMQQAADEMAQNVNEAAQTAAGDNGMMEQAADTAAEVGSGAEQVAEAATGAAVNGTTDMEQQMPEQATAAPAPTLYCGEAGPFANHAQAARLAALLGGGQNAAVVKRSTPVPVAYRVYMPPRSSRAEAKRMVEELKSAGFHDMWLISSGKERNAISLGVFSRKRGALTRARQLRELGFPAKVVPRTKNRSRYWLKFSNLPEDQLKKVTGAVPRGAKVKQSQCSTPSA